MVDEPTEPEEGLVVVGGRLWLNNCRDNKPIFGPKDDPDSKKTNESCCRCGQDYCECANPPCFFTSNAYYNEWEDVELYTKAVLCDGPNPNNYGYMHYSGGANGWWGWYGGWWGGWYGWSWWWGYGGWYGGWYYGYYGALLPGQENESPSPVLRWNLDFYRKWFCGNACYSYMVWVNDQCNGARMTEGNTSPCTNEWRGCCPDSQDPVCDNCIGNCEDGGWWGGWWGGWYGGWWGWYGGGCSCWEDTGEKTGPEGWVSCECGTCWWWGGWYSYQWNLWRAKYATCWNGTTSAHVARLFLWDCESGGWKNVTSEAFELVDGTKVAAGEWTFNYWWATEDTPEEEWPSRWKIEMDQGGIKTSSQSRPGYYNCQPCGCLNRNSCWDNQPITYCDWPEECEPKVKDINSYESDCPEPDPEEE